MNILIEDVSSNLSYYRKAIPINIQRKIEENPSTYIGLNASTNGKIIGICIAKKDIRLSSIQTVYLSVHEKLRNIGIERQFLHFIEMLSEKEKIRFLTFEYVGNRDDNFFNLEKILKEENWSVFEPLNHIYTTKISLVENEKVFKRYKNKTNHLLFYGWSTITEEERFELVEGESKWYPKILSPLIGNQQIDEKLSVFIKVDGKVVGWLILQEVAENMVHFKSMFLSDRYRKKLNGLSLLMRGITNVVSHPKWEYALFSVENNNRQMMSFVEKQLKNTIITKKTVFRSVKVLK